MTTAITETHSEFGAPALVRGSANLYWLISPYGLALLSILPLVISLLIPRDVYEQFADESCLMCNSIWMPVFCLICTLCFLSGAVIHKLIPARRHASRVFSYASIRAELMFVTAGLIVLGALNTASILILISNTSGLIPLLLSGGGAVAKESINTEGSFSQVQPLLIYYNAYALTRYLKGRDFMSSSERRIFLSILLTSITLTILIAIAKVARYEMIPVICSLALVLASHKSKLSQISNAKLASYLALILFIVAGVFSAFSAFRGFVDKDDIITTLFGYGPASYNHLVALLNGELIPTYAGTGLNAFPFLGHIPLFESIFHITDILGLPNAEATFLAEFVDTGHAGLNQMFIWITMYGYIFADLGLWTFLFMMIYGYGASWLFANYDDGGAIGAFLYPMISVAMILTFSFNILLRPSTIAVLAAAIFVSKAERLIRELSIKNENY